MATLVHNTTNDTRLADLVKVVRELGRDTATGKDAKPRLALAIVAAAADGVLSPDAPKGEKDDAYRMYEEYIAAESKKATFAHTQDGIKKGASELRCIIRCGALPTIDAVDVFNRAVTLHGNLDTKERKSLFPALYKVAQMQVAQPDSELSDDQIAEAVGKDAREPKGQAELLRSSLKALEKAREADDANSKIDDRLADLIQATSALLAYIDAQAKRAELLAQLAQIDHAA